MNERKKERKKERRRKRDVALSSSSDIIMLRVCYVTIYNEKTKSVINVKWQQPTRTRTKFCKTEF
jgi:hypothetical protein